MTFLYILIFIIFLIYIAIKLIRNVKKHNAAMNALVAKYLLSINPQMKEKLISKTENILIRDMGCSIDKAKKQILNMKEPVLFGFMALAMAELNINPPKEIWVWQPVTNPFVALINADTQLSMAKAGLEKQGVQIDFSS